MRLSRRAGGSLALGAMRVLLIDPDPARAALVAEGLDGVRPLEVRHAAELDEVFTFVAQKKTRRTS